MARMRQENKTRLLTVPDEATITFDVTRTIREYELLRNCRLHLAHCTVSSGISFYVRAVLMMHDEVVICAALPGNLNE
jgi:hypothetical protein